MHLCFFVHTSTIDVGGFVLFGWCVFFSLFVDKG